MSDRKAELERKKAKLAQIRAEKVLKEEGHIIKEQHREGLACFFSSTMRVVSYSSYRWDVR